MKLAVFDLDFTLWNAGGTWCDATNPPYFKKDGMVFDSSGSHIQLYPDTQKILESLRTSKIEIALASRTGRPDWAKKLLQLFEIDFYFKYKEIYPGSKIQHFQKLSRSSRHSFSDMIFFDDEMRNISEVSNLGITAVLVENGITFRLVKNYLILN